VTPVDASPPEPGHRTFIGTVVFVDILAYSQRPVMQQVELKARLNDMVAGVLAHVAATDRMILDTGDGAALCFLGDPEDALFAASNLRAGAVAAGSELALRIGINLGPLRIVKDVNGQPNILGDGINVAQRVMSFAEPNQILVSRSYYEIVSRLSQEYARLFQYLGIHRDKHVREHEVYAMTGGGGSAAPEAPRAAPPGPAARPTDSVVGSEFVPAGSAAGATFDPGTLARVEAALVDHLGPLARVVVRKGARTARDLPDLCQRLAAHLAEGQRAAFLQRLGALASVPAAAGPATPGPPPSPGGGGRAERPLSPEVLAEAAERLAVYLGPVAKVLVKRTADTASGTRDLYARLAQHIDDPRARQRFVAATEELSGP
jgi:class 3 adenylate cyclase